MAASSSSSPDREYLVNQFKEYMKTEEGKKPVGVFKNSGQRIIRHGSTCISIINKIGLLFSGDGLGINLKTGAKMSYTEEKVFFIGNRMLISVAGNGYWIVYLLEILSEKISNTDPEELKKWTCRNCAKFVYKQQSLGDAAVCEMFGLPKGSLDDCDYFCSMMFGAFENNAATLFYGDDEGIQRVSDADTAASDYIEDCNQPAPRNPFEASSQNTEQEVRATHYGMGAGSLIAQKAIEKLMKGPKGINIAHGDLAEFEEQLILLLSAMKKTCKGNSRKTGGKIKVFYMPPPPGVAHVVYHHHHNAIPGDIVRMRANMYKRLYDDAVEAGSFMAEHYLTEFDKCMKEAARLEQEANVS